MEISLAEVEATTWVPVQAQLVSKNRQRKCHTPPEMDKSVLLLMAALANTAISNPQATRATLGRASSRAYGYSSFGSSSNVE